MSALDSAANTVTLDESASLAVGQPGVFVATGGTGNSGLTASTDNVSSYAVYYLSSVTAVGDATVVAISGVAGGPVISIQPGVNGTLWFVPITALQTRNTVYVGADFGDYEDGEPVTYAVDSGSGVAGLTDGATYTLDKTLGAGYVRLLSDGAETALTDPGGTVFTLTQEKSLADADLIGSVLTGVYPGARVVYDNNSNADIPGILNGETYEVGDVTTDGFFLKTLEGDSVDFTAAGSNTHVFRVVDGNADAPYEIVRTLNSTQFQIQAFTRIEGTAAEFDGATRFVPEMDAVRWNSHTFKSGTAVRYDLVSGPAEGGLADGSTYYVHYLDPDHFTLHGAYADAVTGCNTVELDGAGRDAVHRLSTSSVMADKPYTGQLRIQAGSHDIHCDGANIGYIFNHGEMVRIVHGAGSTDLAVASVAASPSDTVQFTTDHGLATGDWVVYGSGAAAGLQDHRVYYVEAVSTDAVKLYESSADAAAQANAIALSDTSAGSYGAFTVASVGSVFESTVVDIKSSSCLSLLDPLPATSSNAVMLRDTFMMPSMESVLYHRGYDAGLGIQTFRQPNNIYSRQTRAYFPYQSGKATSISFAINFNPPLQIESLVRDSGVVTAVTTDFHNLLPTATVRVAGADDDRWNGVYTVTATPDDRTVTWDLGGADPPDASIARGDLSLIVDSWTQSDVRAGVFDDQNGAYLEFDGSQLYAVRRRSTYQISGKVACEFGSGTVSGSGTAFSQNLHVGCGVVMRGQTYKVVQIDSDVKMHVQPSYRGESRSGVVVSRVDVRRVPQSDFSLDRLDGSGPSGYVFDNTKLQHITIDYSWYGAGKIRYSIQDSSGLPVPCHEFVHNNVESENFMRSGSLPLRFEVANGDAPTYTPTLQHWGATLLIEGGYDPINDIPHRQDSGVRTFTGFDTLALTADTTASALAAIGGVHGSGYSADIDASTFDALRLCEPGTALSGAGLPSGATLAGLVKTSTGGKVFASDAFGESSASAALTLGSAAAVPSAVNLLTIRLVPAADNDRTGNVGEREVVTRILMYVNAFEISCTHDCTVQLLLNTTVQLSTFKRVGPTSFAEFQHHDDDDVVAGGIVLYSARVRGCSQSTTRRCMKLTHIDLPNNIPMTNSLLGGNSVFPDGPETLTMRILPDNIADVGVATPLCAFGSFLWNEI